ncbi:aldo/keto reductase [Amycolatopsis minnesotensis]|uniref:Aldo/keto reductase n=1 Tax=Amycolatopsis minnesotensis TaxID=337894 RepID=A0ABN2RNX1_9PSEU
MRLNPLGRTGIKVSRLCIGTMMFGRDGNRDHDDAIAIIRAALDAGITTVDTADAYSAGETETIVGKALHGRRDDVVLATKVHFPLGDDPNRGGNSRRWITRAIEDSLRRLRTDHVDLYQVHRPDPATDIDETLGALSDLVRAGKVRAIGTSTFAAEEIVEAQWVAEARGRERFRSEQPAYSLLARGVEESVLPTCARYGMGVLTWGPLAGGLLTGRYRRDRPIDLTAGRPNRYPHRFDPAIAANARKLDAVESLLALAAETGISPVQLAIGFVLAHPAVSTAIIGPRTASHLDTLLAAADLDLSAEVLDRIDEIVPPGTTFNRLDAGSPLPPSLADPASRRRTLR